MLIRYQTLSRRLLGDTIFARCNDFDLRDFINVGRGQIAVQGDCVPGYGRLRIHPGEDQYAFSDIEFRPGSGIKGTLAIETISVDVGTGQRPLVPRQWAWFDRYALGEPFQRFGEPHIWSQFGQGSNGTLFISHRPDRDYTLVVKVRGYPIDLIDDTTPEALPYAWTDAVPFYASFYYLAGVDPQAAGLMLQGFQIMMATARGAATPATQPDAFAAGGMTGAAGALADPTIPNRLGISSPRGQQIRDFPAPPSHSNTRQKPHARA